MVRALLACCLVAACARPAAAPLPLPKLGAVPAFELTDQAGAPFSSRALEGKVWVANFIFTRCPDICPTFTAKMGAIQAGTQALGDGLRLVSFTVDPGNKPSNKATKFSQR